MQFSYKKVVSFIIITAVLGMLFSSCSSVKNYPINKPFIFDTRINIYDNKLSKDEKKRLTNELANYWDDSLKVPRLQKFIFFYSIKTPPAFDSMNITRSKKFMSSYLNSQGYYYSELQDSILPFDTVVHHPGIISRLLHPHKEIPNEIRTTVWMNIAVGKNITFDSVGYALLDSSMQKMAMAGSNNSYLKKGSAYTKQNISSELDRIVGLFRDNGYFKISRDDFYAEVDTTNAKLLQLSFDPAEQAKLIAEAAKSRKENPKWDVLIKQKPYKDSTHINKYFVNKTYYYPEATLQDIPDTLIKHNTLPEIVRRSNIIRYKENKFKLRPLREHTFLRHDSVYNETNYYNTINTLSKIGSWQQVDGKVVPTHNDSIDVYYFLVPALKYSFNVDLEGSRNYDIASGNLLGIATNFTFRNRNVWRQAVQSATSLRLGTELNIGNQASDSSKLLQTFQVSLSHSYIFPKLIIPRFRWHFLNKLDNKRTVLAFAGSYTDRRDFYKLRSLTTSWGYDFGLEKKGWAFSFKPLNVELYKLDTLADLRTGLNTNSYLKYIFKDGNVVGSSLSVIRTINSKNNPAVSHRFSLYAEESATLLSLFNIQSDKLFQYIKLQTEYDYSHKFPKTELAGRMYLGSVFPKSGQAVPYFKQFFLGGPNSMRGWQLRQLGLGSSITSDTINGYNERFGDFALEGNLEYRFNIWSNSSFKIGSALFTDIGNIWSIRKDPSNPNAEISIGRLYRDLAMDVGTGIRFDFSYFLIRLDAAYKLKDPARQYNDGWADLKNMQFSETRGNGTVVNNWALQLGIGLPF
ncbi:MAG: BamA/TamA family outer membrane protein [Bacteroidota bacterium]|nr:BamA/TamA family outer membrane protein [Bacteroidota bacterium]